MRKMNDGSLLIRTHGKINLTLDVIGKRADGYHDIVSVMQSISLSDEIRLSLTDEEISAACNHPEVPVDRGNLVCQAARELQRVAGIRKGVHIELSKGIPVAAGLGGGSSDAAAVLLGLNRLWGTGLSHEQLSAIGSGIGADVPFCLLGGTALAEGIGERLLPLPGFAKQWLILIKPPFGVSTRKIYEAFDNFDVAFRPDTSAVVKSLQEGDFLQAIPAMGNVLEQVTTSLYPEVGEIIKGLQAKGVKKALMCGSGPTVCAFVDDRAAAEKIKQDPFGFQGEVFVASTETRGHVFLEG